MSPPASVRIPSETDSSPVLAPSLQRLAAQGVLRRYRTGTVLIDEGDSGDNVYIVLEGRVRAFVSDGRGREITLGLHGPGEYVGEMSLDGGRRSASVQAVEASTCAVVTRDTVLRHIGADSEFALGLIHRLIRRARLATESARSIALLDVYSRLRRLLEERAQPQPDGTRVLAERLTHQAIASEIGCSREMVSRLLKDLDAGGYVSAGRREIVLRRELPARW